MHNESKTEVEAATSAWILKLARWAGGGNPLTRKQESCEEKDMRMWVAKQHQ
jgi:hypothetical protein